MNPTAARHFPEGNAIVYCDRAFDTTCGKTAHGLVRFCRRYRILSVVDSNHAGKDAGCVLDRTPNGIPVVASVAEALEASAHAARRPTHLVIGVATDGGRMPEAARTAVIAAIESGLSVDNGLHTFLSEDAVIAAMARRCGVCIRDVRKPPPRENLHFFSGKIASVTTFKVAVLGTDSAVGKRTTAWTIVTGFMQAGLHTELIGTGQTAWMQGAGYGIILDSLVNDFVSGEIEHAVWSAWQEAHPAVIVIEGQGSLMNPAYPGGYEILAAGRPDVIVLQHAPGRKDYDGFPGYPIHPIEKQIQAIELIAGKPVVAVAVNPEGIAPDRLAETCETVRQRTGLPVFEVLTQGPGDLVAVLGRHMKKHSQPAGYP